MFSVPLLPIEGVVLSPGGYLPLQFSGEEQAELFQDSLAHGRLVGVVQQYRATEERIEQFDLTAGKASADEEEFFAEWDAPPDSDDDSDDLDDDISQSDYMEQVEAGIAAQVENFLDAVDRPRRRQSGQQRDEDAVLFAFRSQEGGHSGAPAATIKPQGGGRIITMPDGKTQLFRVGCIGRIVHFEEFAPNMIAVHLRGEQRFSIVGFDTDELQTNSPQGHIRAVVETENFAVDQHGAVDSPVTQLPTTPAHFNAELIEEYEASIAQQKLRGGFSSARPGGQNQGTETDLTQRVYGLIRKYCRSTDHDAVIGEQLRQEPLLMLAIATLVLPLAELDKQALLEAPSLTERLSLLEVALEMLIHHTVPVTFLQ